MILTLAASNVFNVLSLLLPFVIHSCWCSAILIISFIINVIIVVFSRRRLLLLCITAFIGFILFLCNERVKRERDSKGYYLYVCVYIHFKWKMCFVCARLSSMRCLNWIELNWVFLWLNINDKHLPLRSPDSLLIQPSTKKQLRQSLYKIIIIITRISSLIAFYRFTVCVCVAWLFLLLRVEECNSRRNNGLLCVYLFIYFTFI